jgi:uncharacterized protein involved in exopolysaccharide biosynthesis
LLRCRRSRGDPSLAAPLLRNRDGNAGALAQTAERAAARVHERLQGRSAAAAADRKRLIDLGLEIENAARLAVRTGRVEAVARVIDELEQERAAIECRLAVAEPISVDLEALRRRIDAYARNLGQPSGRPRRRAGPCSRLFSATAVWPPTWTRIEASG